MAEINEKTIEVLKETISQILQKMGIEGTIFARIIEPYESQVSFGTSASDDKENEKEIIVFNIKTNDANILIGHNGENLLALQHLIRIMARKQDEKLIPFAIDINNYKKEKGEKLEGLAKIAADKARKTGRRIVLKPMSSYERRMMHLFLSKEIDLTTESEGVEPNRRITVNYIQRPTV